MQRNYSFTALFHNPILDQMVKIYTLFQTKMAQKPYALVLHIPTLYVACI